MGRGRLLAFAAALAVIVSGWAAAQADAFVYRGSTTIGRANLDGTGVNHGFVTGTSFPLGIAAGGQFV
jgi:hypothetical protein